MRRLLLLVPVLVLALTGCAASPAETLRGDVEVVIGAANGSSGSGDAVRRAVQDLLGTIERQLADGDLTPARAAQLRELALAVQRGAGALDAAPAPSPRPSPPPARSPSPSPPPSPSPSPSPSPEPPSEPSPTPTPEEPEPAPSAPAQLPLPTVTPLLGAPSNPSPTAAAVLQAAPAAGSSPAAR